MLAFNLTLIATLLLGSVWAEPAKQKAAAKTGSDGQNSAFEFWVENDIEYDKNCKNSPKDPCTFNVTVFTVEEGQKLTRQGNVPPGQTMKVKTPPVYEYMVIAIKNVKAVVYLFEDVNANRKTISRGRVLVVTAYNYRAKPCDVDKFFIVSNYVPSNWKPTKNKQVE